MSIELTLAVITRHVTCLQPAGSLGKTMILKKYKGKSILVFTHVSLEGEEFQLVHRPTPTVPLPKPIPKITSIYHLN